MSTDASLEGQGPMRVLTSPPIDQGKLSSSAGQDRSAGIGLWTGKMTVALALAWALGATAPWSKDQEALRSHLKVGWMKDLGPGQLP